MEVFKIRKICETCRHCAIKVFNTARNFPSKVKGFIQDERFSLKIFRLVIFIMTFSHVLPFKLTVDPNGLWRLQSLKGCRKGMSITLLVAWILRASYNVIQVLPDIWKMQSTTSANGNMTIDGGIFTILALLAMLMIMTFVIVYTRDRRWRNCSTFATRSATDSQVSLNFRFYMAWLADLMQLIHLQNELCWNHTQWDAMESQTCSNSTKEIRPWLLFPGFCC